MSWYEIERQTLSATFNKKGIQKIAKNEGYVYLMRNASHQNDIFKIGLTKINTKDRARQLSSTTGSPDKFLVAHEWWVEDCILAERLIHNELLNCRVNNNREFFKIDFSIAMKIITEIVDSINRLI